MTTFERYLLERMRQINYKLDLLIEFHGDVTNLSDEDQAKINQIFALAKAGKRRMSSAVDSD